MREIKFRAWDKKEKKMFQVKILNIFTGAQVNFGINYSVSNGAGYTCKNPTEWFGTSKLNLQRRGRAVLHLAGQRWSVAREFLP